MVNLPPCSSSQIRVQSRNWQAMVYEHEDNIDRSVGQDDSHVSDRWQSRSFPNRDVSYLSVPQC